MTTFSALGLPQVLLNALARLKFEVPTPIQAQAIPPALEGKDVLGTAQTGTGKTGAFGLPLLAHLLSNPQATALVLTPTRELATQVLAAIKTFSESQKSLNSALLIGGDSMVKQFQQLDRNPRIIVGTPGRINDHLNRGTLSLASTTFLVLDEMDRMLDMGFEIQLEKIMQFVAKDHQSLLFSATLPGNIMKISQKYLKSPVRVSVGSTTAPSLNIKQESIQVQEAEKYTRLVEQLEARQGSVIVFVKTKMGADRMAMKLQRDGHQVDALHGDLRQNKRERVIQAFRNKRFRVLIATDVAARGLDIPHIEHVINYDLPQCPEDYIHRIGRTGRAGLEGCALNFLTHSDSAKWRAIQQLLNPGQKHESIAGPSFGPRKSVPKRFMGKRPEGRAAYGEPRRDARGPATGDTRRDAPRGDTRTAASGEPRRDTRGATNGPAHKGAPFKKGPFKKPGRNNGPRAA